MPGIAGIVSKDLNPGHRAELESMVRSMLHEDFYKSGTYLSEEAGVAVGWVTHPGSFSDGMPIWNERKEICLIFSGEDYQDPTNLDQLRSAGHQISGQNASYLIHLYEELGLNFLDRINGWFTRFILFLPNPHPFLFND